MYVVKNTRHDNSKKTTTHFAHFFRFTTATATQVGLDDKGEISVMVMALVWFADDDHVIECHGKGGNSR